MHVCVYNGHIWKARHLNDLYSGSEPRKRFNNGYESDNKNNTNALFNIDDFKLFIYYYQLANILAPILLLVNYLVTAKICSL